MKTFDKLATLALMMCVFAACALAQDPEVVPPTAALANLTEGQGIITSSGNPQWDGFIRTGSDSWGLADGEQALQQPASISDLLEAPRSISTTWCSTQHRAQRQA